MATSTYTPIATTTLVSAASSYTFNSIPQTYTDLVIVINGFTSYSASADAYQLSFNDGSTGLSITRLYGNGSSASSDRYSTPYAGWISTARGADVINIMNYANTTTYKTAITKSSSQGSYPIAGATALLWQSTNAITSVTISDTSGNWQIGTTFSLYGIKAEVGGTGSKATGGTVYTDATYAYHVFTSTGNFVPSASLTADVLVIAGGGGAAGLGSGAGAGGVIYFASQVLSAQNYSCLVGAGGNGVVSGSAGSGTNSQFGSLAAGIGGGAGNGAGGGNGIAGGSGGGASQGNTTNSYSGGSSTQTGTGATAYYGNAGGSVSGGATYAWAGGGGAGAAGNASSSYNPGSAGGAGTNAFSSWATATSTGVSGYYAGGGSASAGFVSGTGLAGGSGGGGKGANYPDGGIAGGSGVANTGSGGGGGGQSSSTSGGSGGSGIIIVRYAK
jgi:hypothetical protein